MPKTVNNPPASEHASGARSSRSPWSPGEHMDPKQEQMNPEAMNLKQERILDDLLAKCRKMEKKTFGCRSKKRQRQVEKEYAKLVKKHEDKWHEFVRKNYQKLQKQAELEALRRECRAQKGEIEAHQAELKAQQDHIKAQQDHIKAQQDHIKAQQDQIKAQQDQIKAQKNYIKAQRSQIVILGI
jgi:chromosome segregation ATPase